jgi:hypothetical protein
MEQRWDETMGQTAISCTDRKLPGSLPELRLTISECGDIVHAGDRSWIKMGSDYVRLGAAAVNVLPF